MAIVQEMRAQLVESMKARDTVRTQFLRYWIAQLTLASGAEVPDAEAVKKMRSVLKEARTGRTSFTPEEMAMIEEWVPPTLAPGQIAEALAGSADAIKSAPKEGMAMGIAMKALAGRPVESDDVRAAVAALRQG